MFLEEELQIAPWTTSANFYQFKHGRCQLALRGVADPSGRGEACAYTRLERRERKVDEDGNDVEPPKKPPPKPAGAETVRALPLPLPLPLHLLLPLPL